MIRAAGPEDAEAIARIFRESRAEAMPWLPVLHPPDDEFETLGCNALALAPRVTLIPEQNQETRRRLEAAGVEVLVYRAKELSKGEGGPTCLTLPLLRG